MNDPGLVLAIMVSRVIGSSGGTSAGTHTVDFSFTKKLCSPTMAGPTLIVFAPDSCVDYRVPTIATITVLLTW